MTRRRHDIDYLCNPKSVAVIGASETRGKWGHELLMGIINGKYKGKIYPINPKAAEIAGLKAYPSVLDIEGPVDLAIIGIKAPLVLQAVEECRQKGVKAALIIATGFAETGEEGKGLQEEVVKAAGEMRIVGPNTAGVLDLGNNFNATFLHPLKGSFDILSQGGNVVVELQINASKRGVGFNKFIHFGNQSDVGIVDCLDYVRDDPNAKVILMYIEGLKPGEGNQLVRVAKEVTKSKPVVALKVGATKEGARGARSHTGSLAGENRIYDAAFEQAGVIRVENSHELLYIGEALAKLPLMKGNRLGVLTDGGSHSAMGCDAASKSGLTLTNLSEETQEKLANILLPQSIKWNPVDFAGAADADLLLFSKAAELMLQDDNIDGLLVAGSCFGGYSRWFGATTEPEVAHEMTRLLAKYGKPIVVHNYFGAEEVPALEIMNKGGILIHTQVETAAKCLGALAKYNKYLERVKGEKPPSAPKEPKRRVGQIIEGVKTVGRSNLLETEAKEILREYGLPVTAFRLAKSSEQAVAAARDIGYPVVAKIVSPQIIHKSDAGGVKLDLKDDSEVAKAFDEIVKNAKKYDKAAQIEGVILSPMEKKGVEVIVGMTKDSQFGPVVMFGLGGIFVEVLKDVSFRVVPLTRSDAYEMVEEIKGLPILKGIRGEEAKDIEAIVDAILKVSQLVSEYPEIQELDLNPILAYSKGVAIVDARILLSEDSTK